MRSVVGNLTLSTAPVAKASGSAMICHYRGSTYRPATGAAHGEDFDSGLKLPTVCPRERDGSERCSVMLDPATALWR